jgi:hypothetical protein
MIQRIFMATGMAALVSVLSIPANAGTLYNFTSFDGPGNNGGGTTVNGINNNGDIVGFIRNANGTFTPLAIGAAPLAMANGINSTRQVVGADSNGTAFFLGGALVTLPSVNGTTTSQTAFGIK